MHQQTRSQSLLSQPRKPEETNRLNRSGLLESDSPRHQKYSVRTKVLALADSTNTMSTLGTPISPASFISMPRLPPTKVSPCLPVNWIPSYHLLGGESPIANSLEIYERVKEELPEFVQELAKRGLTMRQVYPPAGHNRGNGNYFDWTQEYCFGQKILPGDDEPTRRRKAEEQARRLTPRFKWLDDSSLEVIQDVPAFRRINPGGIPTWFNGLAGQRGSAIDQKAIEPPFIGTDGLHYLRPGYGDGTPIPEKWLDRVVEITRELEYVHTWEAGDLIFVNNHRTTHGRAPWVGERVVLVSMWDALPGTLSEY